ncbi:Mannan endo-1,4-beta-mannosidase 2 [Hibiscus syriacus]|uniref:mannan endo-1,4-beta-mannosidase n=1 Tax=Hibiscus syriacus TaxID=106335 RepID=A0A6A2ZAA5_HIBSY|nr:Mannan endo-1,4-beta-mannosidase 2 [Hibiscus syriacus]
MGCYTQFLDLLRVWLLFMSFGDLKLSSFPRERGLSFVERSGTHFFLDGKPLYVNGWNSYWLMSHSVEENTRPKVSAMFQAGTRMGLTVCRTWTFNDGGYNALQISPGQFDEQVLKALDYVIAEARQHEVRLLLSLVNNLQSYGGKTQYVNWAWQKGIGLSSSNDSFFYDPSIRKYFKNYVLVKKFKDKGHNQQPTADQKRAFPKRLADGIGICVPSASIDDAQCASLKVYFLVVTVITVYMPRVVAKPRADVNLLHQFLSAIIVLDSSNLSSAFGGSSMVRSVMFTNKKVNVVLDEMNFLFWKQQVLLTVRSHRLKRLLIGLMPVPLETVIDQNSEVVFNEGFENFMAQDSALASWLLSTISPQDETTASVWSKEVYDVFESCGSYVAPVEQIMSVLKGLPREYQPFMPIITTMPEMLTLDDVSNILIDAKTQLAGFEFSTNNLPMSAHVAQAANRHTFDSKPTQDFNHKSYSGSSGGRSGGHVTLLVINLVLPMLISLKVLSMTESPQANPVSTSREHWVVDSGATHHVTPGVTKIAHHSDYRGLGNLLVGNGVPLDVQTVITKNLLSVSKLARDNRVFFEFRADECCIRDEVIGGFFFEASNVGLFKSMVTTQLDLPIKVIQSGWGASSSQSSYVTSGQQYPALDVIMHSHSLRVPRVSSRMHASSMVSPAHVDYTIHNTHFDSILPSDGDTTIVPSQLSIPTHVDSTSDEGLCTKSRVLEQPVDEPLIVSQSSVVVNVHPMCTHSKAGIFKPKVFLSNLDELVPDIVYKAFQSDKWTTVVYDELDALQKNDT